MSSHVPTFPPYRHLQKSEDSTDSRRQRSCKSMSPLDEGFSAHVLERVRTMCDCERETFCRAMMPVRGSCTTFPMYKLGRPETSHSGRISRTAAN